MPRPRAGWIAQEDRHQIAQAGPGRDADAQDGGFPGRDYGEAQGAS